MPTVPRVSGPSIEQASLPDARINVRADADTFGAGAWDALQRGAQGIMRDQIARAQREREKVDMAKVTEARNGLAAWENSWFDPNNDKGVRAYQGKDALTLQSAMQEDFRRHTATLAQGLGDDKQRQAFGAMAEGYGQQVWSKVNTYAYNESQKYAADTFKASLSTSANTAADAARDGNMQRANQEFDYAATLIEQNARLTGEPPEVVAERTKALRSQINLAGVAGMVQAGRLDAAEEFWQANADSMSEKDRVDAAKSVVLGRIQADPQAAAYSLSASVPRQAGASVAGMPATPIAQIRTDAAAAGVPATTALAIAHMESGINPDARNPKSSAAGLFQLLDSSRQQYAGSPDVGDVAAQSKAGVAYIADSYKALRSGLGREPAPHEVYMAHLFGQAGAQAVLRAGDGERILDVVRRYDPRNANDIVANNGMSGMTVAQVKDKWQAKIGQAMTAVARIPETAPIGADARKGELGTLHNPDGSISTEISITVTDPGINGGKPTNIPLLVKGQTGVDRLQAGDGPTDEQQQIAIQRAQARVKDGGSLPSFETIEEATAAAQGRSDAKGEALDPIVAALPIESRIQLQSAAESQARQGQSEARAALQTQVQDAVTAFSRGEQAPRALTYDDFAAAYGPAMAAREFADYRGWQQFGADVGQIKTMPAQDMGRYLEQRRPAPGSEGYADSVKRFDALAQAAAHVQKARADDPIQAAMQAGGTAVQPLDMNNVRALPDQLALRVAGAQQVSAAYGTPLQVFSKGEAQALSGALNKMPSQQKVEFMQALRGGVTDPRAFSAAMGQIAPDQPVLAVAGSIMQKQAPLTTSGGWLSAGTSLKQSDVAALMIEGDSLLNPQTDDRKADGKGKPFPMPAGAEEKSMREAFNGVTGQAFAGLPNGYQLTYQAARAYYAASMARKGDYTGAFDGAKWDEAIRAATGGVTDYNDRGEVLLPWGMPADQFDGAAQKAFDVTLKARGMSADQLDNYGLQSLSDSRYLVTTGSGWLRDARGEKVVIDLTGGP